MSDLPGVGQKLWDPIFFNFLWEVNTPSGGTIISDPANTVESLREYLDNAASPYSSAGGYFAFEKLPFSLRKNFTQRTTFLLTSFQSDWPEVEYIGSGFPSGTGSTIGVMSATLSALLLRGNVTITSPSISDPPAINLGWLIDPADAEVAVVAFKRCRQIWNAAPAVSIRVGPEIAPGAAVSTDADILNYIRQNVVPIWHARSACAMGNVRDRNAVVDSAAKVFGVTALRVVDISAFLFAVPGHPQASVYMLAEKIADDIKKGK